MSQSHLPNRMVHGGAWVCLALGLCFLIGGWAEAPALRQIYLGAGEASATGGLVFVMLAAILFWLPVPGGVTGWRRSWAGIVMTGGLSAATLLAHQLGLSLGIEEFLLGAESPANDAEIAGMAAPSAVGFLLTAVALAALQRTGESRWRPMVAGMISCVVGSLATFAIASWIIGLPGASPEDAVGPMPLPVALGLAVLSISLIALSHHRSRLGKRVEVRWLPFAVSIGVFTLTGMLWLGIRVGEQKRIENMVIRGAANVERLIETEVQARLLTLERVARRWESRSTANEAEWDFDAGLFLSHYPDTQAIIWVESDFSSRWVTPKADNQSYVDLDFNGTPERFNLMRGARTTGEVQVSEVGSIPSGGRGVMVYVPVRQGAGLMGYVVGVFRVDPLLRSLLAEVVDGFHIEVRDRQKLIYSSGRMMDGVREWEQRGRVQLLESQWGIRIRPKRQTVEELRSPISYAAMAGGGILAVLMGLAIHLVQASRQKERELSSINRSLGDEVRERRQIQDALRESQQRLQAIMDNTSAVIHLKDVDGRYALVNRQFEKLFHTRKDEMVGRTDYDIFPKQMADSFRANDQRVMDSRGSLVIEEIAPHDDGLHTYISIKFPMVDVDGQMTGVCGISTDITDRKVAEAQLRDSHQALELAHDRLRGILEGTTDRIVALDLKYRFLSFNSAFRMHFEKRYGLKIRKGMRVADVLSERPEELERLFDLWMRAMRGEEFQIEEEDRLPDGEKVYLESRFSPIRSESGVLIGATEVTRDVTERRRSEIERNKLLVELANRNDLLISANKELEAFSYTVSHDLRAPIRHIDGFMKLLVRNAGDALDEKALRYVKLITDSAHRMGNLIDDLLAFSRMGRLELRLGSVNMATVVAEVRKDLQPETEGRAVKWEIEDLPRVQADLSLVRQVWMNLLSNALKYSRDREMAVIQVGYSDAADGEDRFFVKDNGVGFDMRYIDRLFGVFQRLHSDEEFEGTGIGLANVRRIIHRHAGRTWAESELGKGATFWFSVPRLKPKNASAELKISAEGDSDG